MSEQRYPIAGFSAEETATPSEFLLDSHVMQKGCTVASSARDSGNSVSTTLRPGLVLGKITASGKYAQYDPSASDGTEVAAGILKDQIKVIDANANAVDAHGNVVFHGRVDESSLHGCDDAAKADLTLIVFD